MSWSQREQRWTARRRISGKYEYGASDEEISRFIGRIWSQREDRYSELRGQIPVTAETAPRVEMSHIGG